MLAGAGPGLAEASRLLHTVANNYVNETPIQKLVALPHDQVNAPATRLF